MNYNYHTHTYRCGHAVGTDEEYVKRAIEGGIKHLGFSEHVPLKFADGSESGFRCPTKEAEDYIISIKRLGEKYKDKLDIKVGFEMEYYPTLFGKTVEYLKSIGAEYVILGEHFLGPENEGYTHASMVGSDSDEAVKSYADLIVEGINTGVFTYVAHPDVLKFFGNSKVYKTEMRRICEAAKAKDVPLEINLLGIRTDRHYPNPLFWEIAGEVGSPVTFGSDAHDPIDTYDGESVKKALKMVKKYGLNYIGEPKIRII